MKRTLLKRSIIGAIAILCASCASLRKPQQPVEQPTPPTTPIKIVVAANASPLENLAAAELQRCLYQMSGTLLPVANTVEAGTPSFILCTRSSLAASNGLALPDEVQKLLATPAEREHRLIKVEANGAQHLILIGREPVDVLHAVYTVLEGYGYGFFLGGEYVPPRRQPEFPLSGVRRAAFQMCGTMPLAGAPAGRSAWSLDDYRAYFDQVSKMRCNLVAFHFSDDEPFAAYLNGEKYEKGEPVEIAKPSMPVKSFGFGTAKYFASENFAPEPAGGPLARDENIRLAQRTLSEALYLASSRGLQTCIGFDVAGNADAAGETEAFLARLEHLVKVYPTLNFICLWPKGANGAGKAVSAEQTARFASLADSFLKARAPQVGLVAAATSREAAALLDGLLPKNAIIATPAALSDSRREWWKIIYADEGAVPFLPDTSATATLEACRSARENSASGAIFAHVRQRSVEFQARAFSAFNWDPMMSDEDCFLALARRICGEANAPKIAPLLATLDKLLAAAPSPLNNSNSAFHIIFKDDESVAKVKDARSQIRLVREALADKMMAREVAALDHVLHKIQWAIYYDETARALTSAKCRKAEDALEAAPTKEEKEKEAAELLAILRDCPLPTGMAHCAALVSSNSELGELADANRTLLADFRKRLESAGKVLGRDTSTELENAFVQSAVFPFYPVSVQNILGPSVLESGRSVVFRAIIPHRGPLSRAEILYRMAGADAFTGAPLKNLGGYVYEGTIKTGDGGGVIEYYIIAEDAQKAASTCPLNAPANTASAAVVQSAGYKLMVVSGDGGAAVGRDWRLEVAVFSVSGALPSEVVLNFRAAGEQKFSQMRMEDVRGNIFAATLPASALAEEGAEYFFEVRDSEGARSRHPREGFALLRPDFSPPSKVRDVRMKAAAADAATLNWETPPDDKGVRRYIIYRRQISPTPEEGFRQIALAWTNEFTDRDLKAGAKYAWRVAAEDFAGNIGESSEEMRQP